MCVTSATVVARLPNKVPAPNAKAAVKDCLSCFNTELLTAVSLARRVAIQIRDGNYCGFFLPATFPGTPKLFAQFDFAVN